MLSSHRWSLFILSTLLLSFPMKDEARILKTLESIEAVKNSAVNVTRVQSIDVVQPTNDESATIPFCHLAMVMPFSGFRPDRVPLKNGVYQGMAAVLLAVEHLNTRNGSLVEQVADLKGTCDIQFTTEIFDSSLSQIEAVDHVIQLISRTENLPSAFVGAARSAVSIPSSIITGLRGFPQISPISTSTQLDDSSQFPLFGRTIPSDAGTAVPAILYLKELGVEHLGIVHVNDAYGNAYALGLQLAAAEYAPEMQIKSYDFPFEATPQIVQQTIGLLKETQFRYFFGILFSTVRYEPFMGEAYRQGIAGTGMHNWMFSDSVSTSVFADPFELNSDLHLASRGTSRIGAVGGVPGIPLYDKFLQAMNDLNNPEDIAFLQSKHPTYPKEPDYIPLQIADDPEFFVKSTAGVVPFLYDAVIALGLAACNATNDDSYFDGKTHFETFKHLEFEGASGTNRYDPTTGTRQASSARFTLQNFVEDPDAIGENDPPNTIRLKTVETDVFRDGVWEQVEPLIFNDGSTLPPPDLPVAQLDPNYIGLPLRATGWAMAGLVLLLSGASVIWTYGYRHQRVIKASQPIFLYMVSAGCALMGSAILLLSFDDEIVADHVCTAFCIAVPWLVSFGWILSFSALFTKTRRVNQIFHNPTFRRIKVTGWDVMKPALLLMTIAGVTLTTWTILSPPSWNREVTEVDVFVRDVETKGFCTYEGGLPYAIVLAVVLLSVLGYAVMEAYVARHVSTEFAESEYIFLVLCSIFLVSFLGIPVMIIAADEPKARFFVAASILFVCCMSILLLIFVPKLAAHRLQSQKDVSSSIELSFGIHDSNRRRSSVPTAGRRISVSGFAAPTTNSNVASEVVENFDNSARGDSNYYTGGGDDDGIKVLLHPKEVEDLQQQVRALRAENAKLLRQNNNNTKAEAAMEAPARTTVPSTSIDMVGAFHSSAASLSSSS